jgi:hypothetical protein
MYGGHWSNSFTEGPEVYDDPWPPLIHDLLTSIGIKLPRGIRVYYPNDPFCDGSPEAVEMLRECLHDMDPEVRAQAAWALGGRFPPLSAAKAIPELVRALEDSDPEVLMQAYRALNKISPESLDQALLMQHK